MKKSLLVLSTALLSVTIAFAQQKNAAVPTVARQAFEKSFPGATKVKWEKEKSDYEVNFMMSGKQMSVLYDNAGTLKETEEKIAISELPASAVAYVKQHHKNAAIKEAAKISKSDGTLNYEAEVNKTDLIFDQAGKFIRQEK
ncbi:hypothetical protein DVR12_02160 [Chitinophaga silvatica]|uniref:Putative beta-lactamase-inhibitor-like PepSY-like domain-containing protein n=1 Tax=Chitinophaga silvatica TaxID=2282649 RepID=A0A3E1YGR6_9BACT|nr:PepSY-like domain-containing protein [Chitinophaga silvatica]RFS26613.1 hypothetical protein DVR12_02160 [Chitinophaga silvatica]